MRPQDPALTEVIIVALAETTPVLEAAGLKSELERSGIHPWAWVINNSLAAAEPTAPLLRRRAAAAEIPHIATVHDHYADRIAVTPLLAVEPVGIPALQALAAGYYLRRAGHRFVILDDQPAPGGAWPHTWASLTLFSPAQYTSLPGWPMPNWPNGSASQTCGRLPARGVSPS